MNSNELLDLKNNISSYFLNLPENIFPNELKQKTTVFLSGSTGWGIAEGFDSKADWDLHLILDNTDYNKFEKKFGADYVIDDQKNNPIVFAQIRSKKWFEERISKLYQGDCLYTWIYNNGVYVQDPLLIEKTAKYYKNIFDSNLEEFARYHYVTFAVRKLDATSSAKRGIEIGARVSNTEMIKAGLQTFSILNGKPYPYNKWLAKHIYMLGETGKQLVALAENALQSSSLEDIIINSKAFKALLETETEKKYNKKQWIGEWWKYNQNPPEMNLTIPTRINEKKKNKIYLKNTGHGR